MPPAIDPSPAGRPFGDAPDHDRSRSGFPAGFGWDPTLTSGARPPAGTLAPSPFAATKTAKARMRPLVPLPVPLPASDATGPASDATGFAGRGKGSPAPQPIMESGAAARREPQGVVLVTALVGALLAAMGSVADFR